MWGFVAMSDPKWWKELEPVWKAVATLATALMIGAVLGGWLGLPATVANHENRLNRVEAQQSRTDNKLDRIICHLEEQRQEDPQWERCER